MPVTTGMRGQGFYDAHSAAQLAAIEAVLPWLEEAAGRMALAEPPSWIGLVDYGCSEGRNSIAMARRLVRALRSRTSRPIQTIHSDLPTNDYRQLLVNLRPDGRSVFDEAEVYSAAVGGSMFEQLLPRASVHVAMTFNAIGFLDRRPDVAVPDYILPMGPSARRNVGVVSDEARAVFARAAADDLERFYRARAAELVPGGQLLVSCFGVDERYRTCDGIYDALNDALLEVVADGGLDRASYERYFMPVYFRSLAEMTAPLAGDGAASSREFRLERAAALEIEVPFVKALEASGDLDAYAAAFTDYLRAFTEPVLRLALADHPALDDLIGDVYARLARLVRRDPAAYEHHYISVAVLSTRL